MVSGVLYIALCVGCAFCVSVSVVCVRGECCVCGVVCVCIVVWCWVLSVCGAAWDAEKLSVCRLKNVQHARVLPVHTEAF